MASGTINRVSDVKTQTVSNTQSRTISAGSYVSVTIDATLSGYTPIGVVGSSLTGGAGCAVTESNFDGNSLRLILTNFSSSSRTVSSVSATVLYKR